MWGCVFSVYPFPLWWLREYNTLSYHHQIGSMNYYPLFRVRSWNNGVRCMSFYILISESTLFSPMSSGEHLADDIFRYIILSEKRCILKLQFHSEVCFEGSNSKYVSVGPANGFATYKRETMEIVADTIITSNYKLAQYESLNQIQTIDDNPCWKFVIMVRRWKINKNKQKQHAKITQTHNQ